MTAQETKRTNAMPLSFSRLPTPFRLRRDHERRGGTNLRRWACYFYGTTGEVIRVLGGVEPVGGDPNRGLWHLSVSVARSGSLHVRPSRAPTDQEFRAACSLIPDVAEWEEEKPGSLVRHAFQRDTRGRPAKQ